MASPAQTEPQRAAQHHARDIAGRRAERHADADLVGAARDGVGQQAVEADRGEQQRPAPPNTPDSSAIMRSGTIDASTCSVERRHFRDRDGLQRVADERGALRRRSTPAAQPCAARTVCDVPRLPGTRSDRSCAAAASCRSTYFASPTTPTIFVDRAVVPAVEREMPAERTAVGEVVARHRLVDDRDARPRLVFER